MGNHVRGKIFAFCTVAAMISMSFAMCISMEAEALDFVDSTTIDAPWTSSFTPLDSAWDSSGTQCMVVGNETNGYGPSAWYYNEPLNSWAPILEGSDPTLKVSHFVENDNTGTTYGSIQAAINAAAPGQTLNVWAGTYNENVVVNKTLILQGNGSANTIINGGNVGSVVTILADDVAFRGFTVTGGPDHTGILLLNVNYCTVESNNVEGNGDGICISGSSYCTVRDNDVRDNAGVGVKTEASQSMNTLVGLSEGGGLRNYGAMYRMGLTGTNYTVTHSFQNGMAEGYPYANPLIQDSLDINKLYGTTENGGKYNSGTLFTVRKDGSQFRILLNFSQAIGASPQGLVQSGNYLYSTTTWGGAFDCGNLFRVNKDGTGYTTLLNFTSSGQHIGTMVLSGATFYGMNGWGGVNGCGCIYRVNIDGTGYTQLYSFITGTAGGGNRPLGSLTLDSTLNILYGMTYQGSYGGISTNAGTIFKYWLANSTYKPFHSFNGTGATRTGAYPRGGLLRIGTTLYGTAYQGGANNYGTLFRINTDGTGMTVLRHLALGDGIYPYSTPVTDGNYLYVTTSGGGPAGCSGVLFSWSLSMGTYAFLHGFSAPDGIYPYASPMLYSGFLFGLCAGGGTMNGGRAFSITTLGTNYFVIHDFNTSYINTNYPTGRLTQSGNYLYGMTCEGGYDDGGMIFRTNLDGTGLTVLREFIGATGYYPWAATLLADGNYLYGTTGNGGTFGNGVIFRIDTDGSGYWVLGNFDTATTGNSPTGELIKVGTTLYGVCGGGGGSNRGTIYKINTDGSAFARIYSFTGGITGGDSPRGGVVYDGSFFYGITLYGGSSNTGTLYRITTAGGGFTILKNFMGGAGDGQYPYGHLVLDGTNLYGVTSNGGANNIGMIYRMTTSGTFTIMKHMTVTEGANLYQGLSLDGSWLYGHTVNSGLYGQGTAFRINKDTFAFTVLRQFQGSPGDAGYPGNCGITVVTYAAQISSDNLIYHNNFIDNFVQALNDDLPSNYWCDVYPIGGNYWSDYAGADIAPTDGIGDVERVIPDTALTMDSYPFMTPDGWAMPYTTFLNVIWDDVNERFWLCGEASASSLSTIYYIRLYEPTVMVPVDGPTSTYTAMAVDNFGNILVGGNGLDYLVYYCPATYDGDIIPSNTGMMTNYNITSITYNPNDMRFYLVGNEKNTDSGVAFVTDQVPLTTGEFCYKDTSSFMNSPGIGTLRSIEWNPSRNYALAVGDGVYRLNSWSGPGNPLSWSVIQEPQAGTVFNDISWDTDGYIEAGIVGRSGTVGKYWRYYHTNPTLLPGHTSVIPVSNYRTCAMKPPSSPKWLIIPSNTEIPRINLSEKDESGTVTFASEFPQIFNVDVWKQSDLTRPDLTDTQLDADSTYTFFIESNYTVFGVDHWNDLSINIAAWYDNGLVGAASVPGSWASANFRTRQFNLTYNPATNTASMVYPTPVGLPPIREFYIANWWQDPVGYGADGFTHHLYINVTFGPQTWAATGASTPTGGSWNKNLALNDLNTWDMQVHMFDIFSTGTYNLTYEEFGIKEFAWIASSGSPTGTAPPGTNDFHLSMPCTISYAANTEHYVTVSVSNLYFGGDVLETKMITANRLKTQNLHPLATVSSSDISAQTSFTAPGTPLYIWGLSVGTPELPPMHGTQMAGPSNTDYLGTMVPPFVLTTIDWWIDVPVSITSGIYIGTITITIMD